MRIASDWLQEFVMVPAPDQLAHVFEMAGIGVENYEDGVFTLEVTSNRGDWLSALGLAREVGAMTDHFMRTPTHTPDETGEPIGGRVTVEIENPEDCPRYAARLIENVTIGPSPDWIQRRLEECGMRPINNIVDITNYVMLETGQPLHAFDAEQVPDGYIQVRRARDGETLTTLDGVKRDLDPEVLLIAGHKAPLAIAGIMGGFDSEVTTGTRHILLESAHFAPLRVRRGKRIAGVVTEASRRFERWVDPNGVLRAADRAAQLLHQYAHGTVAEGSVDRYLRPITDANVTLRMARCNAVLGLHLTATAITALLNRLAFRVQTGDDETLHVAVPTWRRDIAREIDLIEEVARIHGYDHIPTTLPRGANAGSGRALSQRLEAVARVALVRCGLNEVVTYSLESPAAVVRAGLAQDAAAAIKLRNPLSEDYSQLRTSLLPSLLEVLSKNSRQRVQLFELGKVFLPVASSTATEPTPMAKPTPQPAECRRIGIALFNYPVARWQNGAPEIDFYRLKGIVEQLLQALGAPPPEFRATNAAPFHPGRCAALAIDGQDVGLLGEIHPEIAEHYALQHRAYLASLEFDTLVRHISLIKNFTPLPRFPAIDRDVALVVKAEIPAGAVESVLRHAGGELLESAHLFDVYTGSNIAAGYKSMAVALRFRAPDRTLTDSEVETAMNAVVAAAVLELGAQPRV